MVNKSVELIVRRGLLQLFPYSVFYLAEKGKIVVIGVMHYKRAPETWQNRE